MHWQYTPYILPLVMAAVISAGLGRFAWRRRPGPGTTPFAWLMLAVAQWSLAYALELGSTDLPTKLLWAKVHYLGVVIVPPAWLTFVLQYTGRERWLTRRNLTLLAAIPLITLLLVWTNDRHSLIWQDIRLDTSGSFAVIDFGRGVWYWINSTYSYSLLLLGTLLLIQALLRLPHLYRGQTIALLFGTLSPWLGNVLHISGLNPVPHLEPTPFAFTLTGLAITWGLFRFRLLDIAPMACHAIVDGMVDGVIVLDMQNRILDLNPAARRIIGRPSSELIGQPAAQALSKWPNLVAPHRDVIEAQAEIIVADDDTQSCYDRRILPLQDRRGRLTGRLVVLRDITEQVRTEKALRESEERYRNLFETMAEGVILIAPDGQIVQANPSAARILGLKRSEIEDRDFVSPEWEILRTDETPMPPEEMAGPRAMKEKRPVKDIVMGVKRPDGTVSWVNVSAAPLIDGTGKVEGVVGTFTDITERFRIEQTLNKRSVQLATLNRIGYQVASILDRQDLLQHVVDAVRENLGYPQVAVLLLDGEARELYVAAATDDFWEIIPDGYRQPVGKGAIGTAAETGETVLVKHAPGDPRVYEVGKWFSRSSLSAPIKIGGRVVGVLEAEAQVSNAFDEHDVLMMDTLADQVAVAIENARLLEGLEAEVVARTAEIRAEKERIDTILRNVGDAITVADLDMRIQYVNDAFTELTGYTAEEVLGQSISSVGAVIESEHVLQSMQSTVAEGKVWQGEAVGRRKDGRSYDAILTIASIQDSEGNLVSYVSSHRDISWQKELDRARSQFINNVSHQLRTPATNIKLYAQLLRKQFRSEKTEHYAQVLEDQSDRLVHLIQDILEMTELDSGQAFTNWEPVSLPTIIQDAATRYQNQTEASSLTLTVTPTPAYLPVVKGNQVRLSQALDELLENALLFTPAGGQVTIEAGTAEEEGRCWVTIAVRDTGPGIPPEEQERIFDRFFRGSLAESGHIPGTGLGLSLVQEIVRAHGGRVMVKSQPGEGCTFTLWLPVAPSQ